MTETFGTDKVKITVSNVPFKTRLARSDSGDFDVVMTAWSADFADPTDAPAKTCLTYCSRSTDLARA